MKCHKCDFETSDHKSMDAHVVGIHAIVACDKCEYITEDNDILKQHKKKHMGGLLYRCNICEFEATRQIILENQIEVKHEKKIPWWDEAEEGMGEHYCDKCEKKFNHFFVKRYHKCT